MKLFSKKLSFSIFSYQMVGNETVRAHRKISFSMEITIFHKHPN
ncbi:hypothetical protein M6B38_198525 [Iris pallida]|uniref:Uncharacterized protein n=1 Tax=Iris pallida TaxID=29817 RepID=A0AAX6EB68_IRIPA|nr:hypothetical protein M6B38_198525 [Iris pallida]